MTTRFSIELVIHGIPTVRHVLDIEESMRQALRQFSRSSSGNLLKIESAKVIPAGFLLGDLMTVRFSAELDIEDVQHERRRRDLMESIRRGLSVFCCQGADELAVVGRELAAVVEKRPPGSECSSRSEAVERIA